MPVNTFGDITIIVVEKSHTIGELVDIVNKNFEEILLNGGGPTGPQGDPGSQGLPGATIVGPAGPTGETGTIIHFVDSVLNDGDIVSDVDHREGDIIIDSNGIYYQVEDQGGTLRYVFRINFASISLSSYLVNYAGIDSQGVNPIINHHYDNADNDTNTLFIAARSPEDGSNDKVKYRRLVLGDVPSFLIENSPLTLVNLIPDSDTNAGDSPFSQLVIKYRDSKDAALSTSNMKFTHTEDADEIVSSINSGDISIIMTNDKNDADQHTTRLKSKRVTLVGSSDLETPVNSLTLVINDTNSSLSSPQVVNISAPMDFKNGVLMTSNTNSIDNGSTFTLAITASSNPVQKLNITVPSNRQVGRISTISGGTTGQVLIITNSSVGDKGVILDNSDNISMNRPVTSLKAGESAIIKYDGTNWVQIGVNDYKITYISDADISNDFDNLIDDGIYMIYNEAGVDYLNNRLDNPVTQGPVDEGDGPVEEGGGGDSLPEVGGTDGDTIDNTSPSSVDGYGVITYVLRTYNDIVTQKHANLVTGEIWYRTRYYDGTWTDWEKVIKVTSGEGGWNNVLIGDTGYDPGQITVISTNHRYSYSIFNSTCSIKLYIKGVCQTDNPSDFYLNLPAGVTPTTLGLSAQSPCTLIINEDDDVNRKIVPARIRAYPDHLEVQYWGEILQTDNVRIIADFNLPIG